MKKIENAASPFDYVNKILQDPYLVERVEYLVLPSRRKRQNKKNKKNWGVSIQIMPTAVLAKFGKNRMLICHPSILVKVRRGRCG